MTQEDTKLPHWMGQCGWIPRHSFCTLNVWLTCAVSWMEFADVSLWINVFRDHHNISQRGTSRRYLHKLWILKRHMARQVRS
jgi:hypothetical protein